MKKLNNTLTWCAMTAVVGCAATASENYDLRYAPGTGGADMSAPLEGGWVFQMPAYAYSGTVDTSSTTVTNLQLLGAPIPSTATTMVSGQIKLSVDALLPRLTYMSATRFLGATVGVTALLPLIRQKTAVSVSGVSTSVNPAGVGLEQPFGTPINTMATQGAANVASANSNVSSGIGDFEIAPILRWGDEASQWLFVPAIILPTGKYSSNNAANPGDGNFYTFRPLVQYSYIGDGWDMGMRASIAINSKNKDSNFRTGNYADLDVTLMKSLSDAWRIGAAGYAMVQTTADTRDSASSDPAVEARQDLTVNQKGHDFAAGPEIAWIQGAGTMMIDGRILKEFSAQDRPKGTAFWLNVSMPF